MPVKVDNVSYWAVIRAAGKILKLVRAIAMKDIEAITRHAFEVAAVFTNIEEVMDEAAVNELAADIEAVVVQFLGDGSPAALPVPTA